MSTPFWDSWLAVKATGASKRPSNVSVYEEKAGGRALTTDALQDAIRDHFVGLEVIQEIGGFPKALAVLRGSLPVGKRTQSGDMGELLATEFVSQKSPFTVPVKRLRYKDDRKVAMRGDDLIAIRVGPKPAVLKVESKSRARIGKEAIADAASQLAKNSGRPNPSSLAFTSKRLREMRLNDLAEFVENVQAGAIPGLKLRHLVFALSGTDCEEHLAARANGAPVPRKLVALVVADHQRFIEEAFRTAYG